MAKQTQNAPKTLQYLCITTFAVCVGTRIFALEADVIWPSVVIYGIILYLLSQGKKGGRLLFFLLSLFELLVSLMGCLAIYLGLTKEWFASLYGQFLPVYVGHVLLGACHIMTCVYLMKHKKTA